ncbi:hypothetical protein PMAYCL1PPCAC_11067 [Pristionchus mayeri]|uniref:Uncharacterized protein n=1 Tax=Pristionchus mayeri TaxID=1317129 RepID=A0AAN4ZMB5_9BILA|nr:hypothetical protein PMAYCL1PPCAC_11067 [Pristionchus mayeri]
MFSTNPSTNIMWGVGGRSILSGLSIDRLEVVLRLFLVAFFSQWLNSFGPYARQTGQSSTIFEPSADGLQSTVHEHARSSNDFRLDDTGHSSEGHHGVCVLLIEHFAVRIFRCAGSDHIEDHVVPSVLGDPFHRFAGDLAKNLGAIDTVTVSADRLSGLGSLFYRSINEHR